MSIRRLFLQNRGGAIDDRFIITVKTDNAGTSADNQFTIPTSTIGITQSFNYDIETSDGQTITGNTGNTTITFPSAGTYDIFISGSFPYMFFANGGDKLKLLDVKNFGIYALGSTSQFQSFYGCSNMVISATDSGNFGSVTNFRGTWQFCSSLTSFPLIDTSSGTDFGGNFSGAWQNCSSLTSFPLIDTSSGTDFEYTWQNCSSLISFPLIDTSSGTNFEYTWANCSSLTTFPLLDTSSGTNFKDAWRSCNSLTSFPLIDTSSGTIFQAAWNGCSSLISFPLIDTSSATALNGAWFSCLSLTSFPANAFDTNIATNYTNSFGITALTTQSIDDILVSLDTSGVSNGTFTQSGGQAPSATGEAAIDSLVGKGWTVTVTGGYTPPQLLLDEYPNASVAYSLRDLSTASVGNAVVRVRRSSDNVEQDFTSTEITDGTLTTFTGANDGFVTTWYDQSGSGNNAAQSTATKQPKLVTIGVVELDNGKPTLNNFADGRYFTLSNSISFDGIDTSVFYVNNDKRIFGNPSGILGANTTIPYLLVHNDNTIAVSDAFGYQIYSNTSLLGQALNTIINFSNISIDYILNGNLQTVATSATWGNLSGRPYTTLGATFNGNREFIGDFQEIIIYPSDQSANRTGIETNINTEYSIY